MWYAAHLITVFRYRNRRQRKFHVWENIALIEAASVDEAWEKAESLGREDTGHDDPSTTIDGIPARLEFAGVRKVIECSVDGQGERPGHGTEIAYNKFNVASRADLERLVKGDPVPVEYQE
jgi:hypothetical protein